MPRPQSQPPADRPEPRRTGETDAARAAALERICAGFTTTISPHSAVRLASLLSAPAYAQAA